jgi:hypothetical protein
MKTVPKKVVAAYKMAETGNARIIINRINLLEVYYGFYHDKGKEYAENVVDNVEKSIVLISEFDILEGKEPIVFHWIR